MNDDQDKKYDLPEKGTREYHIRYLKKLRGWLKLNPKNNPVVTEEFEALNWVLREIGEE